MSKSRLDLENQPGYSYEPYHSTAKRAPVKPLVFLPHTLSERTGPVFGDTPIAETDHDLTRQHTGEPLGQRMIVEGRVVDDEGNPLPRTLIEIWQTNAAGRYRHKLDDFRAPLDPNFTGSGRILTDENGRYRFLTVKPGAYPWNNHPNAWRPAHIHFSLFGPSFVSRFMTQMYFEGDPMLAYDPVFQSIPDRAKHRVIADFDMSLTEEKWALGYRFDLVLRVRTRLRRRNKAMDLIPTAHQPIGPYYHFALTPGWASGDNSAGVMAGPQTQGDRIQLTVRVLDKDAGPVTNAMIELWQADAGGKYNHPADTQKKAADPAFRGFGRLATDDQGLCVFETVKPGQAPGLTERLQAPHINVSIYAPGLLRRAVTRIYFDGDPTNATDEILGLVPEDRRSTLMARLGGGSCEWRFDLHLTGTCETVFFDV